MDCDPDLDQTMANVELVRAISYTPIYSSFRWIEPILCYDVNIKKLCSSSMYKPNL